MRGVLPSRLLSSKELRQLIIEVGKALNLPSNDACDALFCSPQQQAGMTVLLGDDAKTGRIETTGRFDLPKDPD